MTFEQFKQTLRRRWWWSPRPPWRYTTPHGAYWGAGSNPGIFNLAWAYSGIQSSDEDIRDYASQVYWVVNDAPLCMVGHLSLADHAFMLSLNEFEHFLKHNQDAVRAYPFCDKTVTPESILRALRRRARA